MRAILDDGSISELEHEGLRIPLQQPVPLKQYEKFRRIVEPALDYLDLRRITLVGQQREAEASEWRDVEVAAFLRKATEYQTAFLQPLAESGDSWMTTTDVLRRVSSIVKDKVGSQSLGAVRGQLKRKYTKLARESLEKAKWDDRDGQMRYKLRRQYLAAVRKFFGISS